MPSQLKGFSHLAEALSKDWRRIARPNQLPPPGDWLCWLVCAGRGFGKTRAGSEWVRFKVSQGCRRIALVGATASDCRDVMIEGQSGILSIGLKSERPTYEPSKRRLTWPNGAIATAYSADEPDRMRGPQHDAAWCDELAAYPYPEIFDQLMFGLRLGQHPQVIVTTTPRPVKIIRSLLEREGRDVVVTRGSTFENKANLAPSFLNEITTRYAGTRLGRQEIQAEVLDDIPGAIFQRSWFDRDRREKAPDDLLQIVVAIDPATTSGEDADETGIVVVGAAQENGVDHAYVMEDLSGKYSPTEWARIAITAYHRYSASRIVAETNAGGEMVENTLRQVDANVAFREVKASRGKVRRAEPVAALSEQGRLHLVGSFPALEDQCAALTPDFDRVKAGFSPDRLDAMVWGVTDIVIDRNPFSLVSRNDLLGDKEVQLPQRSQCIVAVIDIDPTGTVAIVYGGTSPGTIKPKLMILDAIVTPLHGRVFADVKAHLDELVAERRAEGSFALMPISLQPHAGAAGLHHEPISASFDPDSTFLSAATYISRGDVKISAPTLAMGQIGAALDVRAGEDTKVNPLRRAVLTLISAVFETVVQDA
jgi:phage terminase large subunit-like protein